MKKTLIIACSVLLALFIALTIIPIRDTDNEEAPHRLFIAQGTTSKAVFDSLSANPSIRMKSPFFLALKCATFFRTIQPGCYDLDGISALRLVRNITSGRQVPVKVTFNNIRTLDDLATRLASQMMADSAAFMHVFYDSLTLNKYQCDSASVVSLFIPDTYEVYWTESPNRLLEKIYKNYCAFWNDERRSLAAAAQLSQTEVSTIASIVEEESNLKSEQPTIAGLYINRLRSGMKLQADPTIKFALGNFTLKRIRLEQVNACASSPYNTYTHIGLPPGPIRIPSKQCLDAVLNYQHHKYLFMCAKGHGEAGHNFAVTFAEHRRNANAYQKHLNEIGIQ